MSNHADLDSFGTHATPQHQFSQGLESVPDGDHTCRFVEAEIVTRQGHKMVRCDVEFPDLHRTIEHIYWLTRQESVNAFLAEMSALGFPAHTWGTGGGKIPLSQAIPQCVTSLSGIAFRAVKTTRVVPAKPASFGQPAKDAATYRDLRIQGRTGVNGVQTPAPSSLDYDDKNVPF